MFCNEGGVRGGREFARQVYFKQYFPRHELKRNNFKSHFNLPCSKNLHVTYLFWAFLRVTYRPFTTLLLYYAYILSYRTKTRAQVMGWVEVGSESVVLLLQHLNFTERESFLRKIIENNEKV